MQHGRSHSSRVASARTHLTRQSQATAGCRGKHAGLVSQWDRWLHRSIGCVQSLLIDQGQAHIMSTATPSPRSCKAGREVEATPWFRTWLSVDPQPASINPMININIVFICAFLVDCGRIICDSAIKNDSSGILCSRLLVTVLDSSMI